MLRFLRKLRRQITNAAISLRAVYIVHEKIAKDRRAREFFDRYRSKLLRQRELEKRRLRRQIFDQHWLVPFVFHGLALLYAMVFPRVCSLNTALDAELMVLWLIAMPTMIIYVTYAPVRRRNAELELEAAEAMGDYVFD